MIFFKPISIIPVIAICILSCNNKQKESYAISDFRDSLQPYLTQIVSKAIVGSPYAYNYVDYIKDNMTLSELKNLSRSEHPILRAVAFRVLLQNQGVDQFQLLMSNLDDTATIATDGGEFETQYQYISDYFIGMSTWQTKQLRDSTIDKVLRQYNYLVSAYTVLDRLPAQEKYYKEIKSMTQRERPFRQIEYSLLGLAKFKKADDDKFISGILLKNSWELGPRSFQLMREYPDTIYLEVFKKYAERDLLKIICVWNNTNNAESFFEAVASYKQVRSADILTTVLDKLASSVCTKNNTYLKDRLYESIWANQCAAYSGLLKKIRPYMARYGKDSLGIPLMPGELDTTNRSNIHWYNY